MLCRYFWIRKNDPVVKNEFSHPPWRLWRETFSHSTAIIQPASERTTRTIEFDEPQCTWSAQYLVIFRLLFQWTTMIRETKPRNQNIALDGARQQQWNSHVTVEEHELPFYRIVPFHDQSIVFAGDVQHLHEKLSATCPCRTGGRNRWCHCDNAVMPIVWIRV